MATGKAAQRRHMQGSEPAEGLLRFARQAVFAQRIYPPFLLPLVPRIVPDLNAGPPPIRHPRLMR